MAGCHHRHPRDGAGAVRREQFSRHGVPQRGPHRVAVQPDAQHPEAVRPDGGEGRRRRDGRESIASRRRSRHRKAGVHAGGTAVRHRLPAGAVQQVHARGAELRTTGHVRVLPLRAGVPRGDAGVGRRLRHDDG